jgi:hypothetical protein
VLAEGSGLGCRDEQQDGLGWGGVGGGSSLGFRACVGAFSVVVVARRST